MDHGITKYVAAAANNVVVTAKPALLMGILFGADNGSAIVEVSNSPDDGDGDIQLYIAGDNLGTKVRYLIINAVFPKGICADIANQTHTTFIYKNIGS